MDTARGDASSPADEKPQPEISATQLPEVTQVEAPAQAMITTVRFQQHREHMAQVLKQLEQELAEYLARRDAMRRKLDDVDHAMSSQIADVDATLRIYRVGLNSVGPRQDRTEAKD